MSSSIVWVDTGRDLLLFNSDDGTYHHISAEAAAIWRRLADGAHRHEIVAELAVTYDAEAETIGTDVDRFIADAVDLGLLRTV